MLESTRGYQEASWKAGCEEEPLEVQRGGAGGGMPQKLGIVGMRNTKGLQSVRMDYSM